MHIAIPEGWTDIEPDVPVGDHASWMFQSNEDPHDEIVIVSSGCVGCAQSPPTQVVPDGAYGIVELMATEAGYALSNEAQATSDDQGPPGSDDLPAGYETNGVTIEAGAQSDPAVEYAFVVITEPVTMHNLATAVLNSVSIVPNSATTPPTTEDRATVAYNDLQGAWSDGTGFNATFSPDPGQPGVLTTSLGGTGTPTATGITFTGVYAGSGSLTIAYNFAEDHDTITVSDGSSTYTAYRSTAAATP